MTLTDFLLARIAEEEAVARSMPFAPTWSAHPEETGQPIRAGKARIATCAESVMEHIARHDPARVLAECEAKRRIVGLTTPGAQYPDYEGGYESAWQAALSLLALPYADHPDYREEWRP